MTTGIEPATSQLVAQCLHHRVPHLPPSDLYVFIQRHEGVTGSGGIAQGTLISTEDEGDRFIAVKKTVCTHR